MAYEVVMAGAGGPGDPPAQSSHSSYGEFVVPGEIINVEPGFLRGHGTYVDSQSRLISSVSGVVERVNRLVSVRPLRARYPPEVGDTVVARVVATARGRWVCDIEGRQEAVLLLSSVSLPGGAQRRRTADDELNMRTLLCEPDLVCAEVQSLFQDGSASLHTRSARHGRLGAGQIVAVSQGLVRRSREHVARVGEFGVELVVGQNGVVWIGRPEGADRNPIAPVPDPTAQKKTFRPVRTRDDEVALRSQMAMYANAVSALDAVAAPVDIASIEAVVQEAQARGVAPKDMMTPSRIVEITRAALGWE